MPIKKKRCVGIYVNKVTEGQKGLYLTSKEQLDANPVIKS